MGNACPEAKAAADYITDDVTADGLGQRTAPFRPAVSSFPHTVPSLCVDYTRGDFSMSSYVQRLRARLASCPAPDVPFLAILLILLCYGLIMLFSAGYAVALYRRGDAYTYIRPQLLFAALGVVAMYGGQPHRLSYLATNWPGPCWPFAGAAHRGALHAGVQRLQAVDRAARPGHPAAQRDRQVFGGAGLFAHIISLNHDRDEDLLHRGVLPFGVILGTVAVLMLLEPHLSGTLLILSIGAVLMFVGGTGLKWFGIAGGLGVGAIAAAVIALPELVPYATDRLVSWRDPFADPLGEGHQTIQSLYAIASGGIAGLGLGNSRQKYLYVPEPQNDFIFSILCEELGFIGAALVVGAVPAAASAGYLHRRACPG